MEAWPRWAGLLHAHNVDAVAVNVGGAVSAGLLVWCWRVTNKRAVELSLLVLFALGLTLFLSFLISSLHPPVARVA
eukprot:scaffold2835_cov105-Isochrysis_galbana.AAC.11